MWPVSPSTSISLSRLFGASGAISVSFFFFFPFRFLLLTRTFPVCCDLNAFLLLLLFDFPPSRLSHVTSFSTEVRYCTKPCARLAQGTGLEELEDLGFFGFFSFLMIIRPVCVRVQIMTTVAFCSLSFLVFRV